ncbi:MAG TPA: ABC transporter ATP-binding protein [Candidatus Mediterraneibacter faecavium]|uniref:ABC transporter ATP-binding protein n=1 Tax=Candidatus Mediterraneibacter faecavium TaxID=2838668 RepID=A0A9D2TMV6_9FIRM|nr:ABC transporter ATP-binding protein [Candidatus Mediterraneibacter faecavium]
MEYAIEVRNLTKRYKDFTLDDISFALPRGTVMGLIGENGAGKSTLINSILGITDSKSSLTSMLGLDMKTHSKMIKEDIAVIFNDSHYDVNLTPKIIGHILSKVYKNWDAPLFSRYLERFSLPEKKKIKKLSTGMRVKLEFAAALSHHPKLLILDEATSGLDPVFRDEILDILREFTEDETHAVLMSSHITSDLDKIADYIAYLHEGKIQFIKTYDEIRNDYGIITCGQELFDSLSRDDIAAYKKEPYSYRVLVKNRAKLRQVFHDIPMENASVEDIMLFYVKGEKVK